MKSVAVIACASVIGAIFMGGAAAAKNYGPGVTDTEVKIGQTMPYSGPASSFATIGKSMAAYFAKVNAEGASTGAKSTSFHSTMATVHPRPSSRRVDWSKARKCWRLSAPSARRRILLSRNTSTQERCRRCFWVRVPIGYRNRRLTRGPWDGSQTTTPRA